MIDDVPLMQRIEGRRHPGNENNSLFILHFARFVVPLHKFRDTWQIGFIYVWPT